MPRPSLQDIRLVVLDVDGTLVDAFDDIYHSALHVFEVLGYPALDAATVRSFVGNGAINLMRRALKTEDEATLEKAVRLWTEHAMAHSGENARLYPGALEFLQFLRNSGIKSAVLSNKIHSVTVSLLDKLGVLTLLDAAWGEKPELGRKPDPWPLLALMRELGAKPEETLFVGDGRPDIEVARAAGIRSCGVTWGLSAREDLESFGADWVVDRFEEMTQTMNPGATAPPEHSVTQEK